MVWSSTSAEIGAWQTGDWRKHHYEAAQATLLGHELRWLRSGTSFDGKGIAQREMLSGSASLQLRARVPGRVGDRSSSRQCALAFSKPDLGELLMTLVASSAPGKRRRGVVASRTSLCSIGKLRAWPRPPHSGKGRTPTGLQWRCDHSLYAPRI